MKGLNKILFFTLFLSSFLLAGLPSVLAGYGIDPGYQTTLGLPTNLESTTLNILKWAISMIGLLSVILIIYAGFVWMTAAGNEEKVAQAKKIIMAAVIGLIIIILAWAIVWFVANNIK